MSVRPCQNLKFEIRCVTNACVHFGPHARTFFKLRSFSTSLDPLGTTFGQSACREPCRDPVALGKYTWRPTGRGAPSPWRRRRRHGRVSYCHIYQHALLTASREVGEHDLSGICCIVTAGISPYTNIFFNSSPFVCLPAEHPRSPVRRGARLA